MTTESDKLIEMDIALGYASSPIEINILEKLDTITKELVNLRNEVNELKKNKDTYLVPIVKRDEQPKVELTKYYKLERKIRDNLDGTMEVEIVGNYQTIKDVGDALGFKEGKAFNIYQKKNKLANEIFITKIE